MTEKYGTCRENYSAFCVFCTPISEAHSALSWGPFELGDSFGLSFKVTFFFFNAPCYYPFFLQLSKTICMDETMAPHRRRFNQHFIFIERKPHGTKFETITNESLFIFRLLLHRRTENDAEKSVLMRSKRECLNREKLPLSFSSSFSSQNEKFEISLPNNNIIKPFFVNHLPVFYFIFTSPLVFI